MDTKTWKNNFIPKTQLNILKTSKKYMYMKMMYMKMMSRL